MITSQEFTKINNQVQEAVSESLNKLKEIDKENYILFLANGEYIENNENSIQNQSPYSIDYRLDQFDDSTRLEFLSEFLNTYYRFPNNQNSIDDNSFRMNLELMIYTHIWESKPFLKKLCRLSKLVNGEEYDWKLNEQDIDKHKFIRNIIRHNFIAAQVSLGEVIKKGFHSSLRNAFAHSQYSFDTMNNHNSINLYNYSGKSWELQTISFDEWSIRFVYSALLSFHFIKTIHNKRINLISEFGDDTFEIKHPTKSGCFKLGKIKYHKEGNSFSLHSVV